MTALCRPEELDEGECRRFDLPDGRGAVLLVRHEGRTRAFVDACPHAGKTLDARPGHFLTDRDVLLCGHHHAVFRMDDGVCLGGPCSGQRLRALPLTLEDGRLTLAPDADARAWRARL